VKNAKNKFKLFSPRLTVTALLIVCMVLSTVTVVGATPSDSIQSDFATMLEPTVLRSMYEFIEERPFFYLEPCVEFVSPATLADAFEDNSVIVVLDRVTSRTTSRAGSRDFTAIDFSDVGALYVEDLLWLGESESSYAQRLWAAEQHLALIEEGYFSVSRAQTMAIEVEYLDARAAGEYNTLVNFDEFRRILLVRLDQNCRENVLRSARQLQQREYVVVAEPNFFEVPLSYIPNPNDPYFHLPPGNVDYQWAVRRIGLPQAWAFIGNTPTAEISVGIVGHGIDANHPELIGRVRALSCGSITTDTHTGTRQAGIIGARGNNGIGVAGISWNVRMVSMSASSSFDPDHVFNHAASITAINEARNELIPILTRSFQSNIFCWDSWYWTPGSHPALNHAVQSYTGLFVNSAGNSNINRDSAPQFPGLQNVLIVAASDMNDNRSNWGSQQSCFGPNSVHLFAPGGGLINGVARDIRTTAPNNSYGFYNGTSAAAPHVAGVAALLMSVRPDATVQQIRQAILDGAEWVPSLNGMTIANGRLCAYGALRQLIHTTTTVNNWDALRTAIQTAPAMQTTHIRLSANFAAPNTFAGDAITIPFGRSIFITGNDASVRTITQTRLNQRHFLVDGQLILGRNVTLCGGAANTMSGGVSVRAGGTLTMLDGSVIENCRANFGGAVNLQGASPAARATFNMMGGTIRNNRARWGGGVEIFSNGRMNMSGGTISNNMADNEGGGVWVNGAVAHGLGLLMTGGSISNNLAAINGGGIYVNAGNSAFLSVAPNTTITGNTPNNTNPLRFMANMYATLYCDAESVMALRLEMMNEELGYEVSAEDTGYDLGLPPMQLEIPEYEPTTEDISASS